MPEPIIPKIKIPADTMTNTKASHAPTNEERVFKKNFLSII